MNSEASSTFSVNGETYSYVRIQALEEKGVGPVSTLPYCLKVLLEAALREFDGTAVTEEHIRHLANWTVSRARNQEIPFKPARILLHDTTGLPTIVDLAAMRETVHRMGGSASRVNPQIPVDLVVDHSLTVDYFAAADALERNESKEFERNQERFRFLRWAQKAFDHVNVIPPSTGIMHQINMELLSSIAATKSINGSTFIVPDSLVGTDSHTTMINGLGIVAWGVGGIEAQAAMLGQPLYVETPDVLGFKLTGELPEGTTATDLALTITSLLRKKGVVGKFVEFIGPGVSRMSVADRATIANMAPEYGATMGFFPVDQSTLNYMRLIGRPEQQVSLIEAYYRAQGMLMSPEQPEPIYSDTMELDLSTIVPSLAGPKRPQDLVSLAQMKETHRNSLSAPPQAGGYGLTEEHWNDEAAIGNADGTSSVIKHGSVVLAAITSCTNTSNPSVLISAGLVAKKAVELGLRKPAYVKSSLTPGSRVVTDYLAESGLLRYLEQLGFHIAGYGCATCIGNSGPLSDEISSAIVQKDLVVAGVLSGNRNFEGRIHPLIKSNYLASPPLVVAYALAGTVDINLTEEPIGHDARNRPVFLRDIWPSSSEIEQWMQLAVRPDLYLHRYENVYEANERWNQLDSPEHELYLWDERSTYIQEPPFLSSLQEQVPDIEDIKSARVLALLGDSITTDHASPSGAIKTDSPAGMFLQEQGVQPKDFNSYPSRRGNHEVMIRGAFANVRIRNQLVPGTEGGVTTYFPTGETLPIYYAAMKYQSDGTPLVIIAGKEYGTGSSRDWAAKGPFLLGVRIIMAESFERIHRSNLVGMGILPLQFPQGMNALTLGITGSESFETIGLHNEIKPGQVLKVRAIRSDGSSFEFDVILRLDNRIEVDYFRNGGIMQSVVRKLFVDSK